MPPSAPARILVVEDDGAIRATLVDILEFNGHTVSQTNNGTDGLALAQNERPDVILTDIAMPGLNGFELIQALRADERTRPIPIIIVSASVEPERMRRGMDLGAEDFIVKPFTESQVLRSVQARLEKKALLDELDAFAHTVAHDLKNPIAVLMMRIGLLRMTWENGDETARQKHVAEIESQTQRLANIVDELLLLAGVQRQNVPLKALDTAEIVRESIARVENLVKKSGAQIAQPASWPAALGHGPWVTEIWTNYLSNAIKYGGEPPQVQLGADIVREGKSVRFWVRDNGPGLSREQQSTLFQIFSRVTETRVKGHGLGLSIVRRIAEKLGGAVGVDSQPGSGSRFWFELPAVGPE